MIPDDIKSNNGELLHFGWLSTLFVSEKHRGKQVAQKLLYAAEKAYSQNLMITEFTESAGRLYYKIGIFQDFAEKKAIRYYFKSNLAELLPSKKTFFDKNKKWLRVFDNTINAFIPYLSKRENFLYNISYQWDDELEDFITTHQKNSIGRSSEEFKWILNYPWLSTEYEEPNYLFSSFSPDYKIFWVKIYQDKKIVATLLCSIRHHHLKIMFYFADQPEIIIQFLPNIMRRYNIKMMTIYDDQLNHEAQKKNYIKPLYSKSLIRKYLIHNSFNEKLGTGFQFDFKDGDGDFCFT